MGGQPGVISFHQTTRFSTPITMRAVAHPAANVAQAGQQVQQVQQVSEQLQTVTSVVTATAKPATGSVGERETPVLVATEVPVATQVWPYFFDWFDCWSQVFSFWNLFISACAKVFNWWNWSSEDGIDQLRDNIDIRDGTGSDNDTSPSGYSKGRNHFGCGCSSSLCRHQCPEISTDSQQSQSARPSWARHDRTVDYNQLRWNIDPNTSVDPGPLTDRPYSGHGYCGGGSRQMERSRHSEWITQLGRWIGNTGSR